MIKNVPLLYFKYSSGKNFVSKPPTDTAIKFNIQKAIVAPSQMFNGLCFAAVKDIIASCVLSPSSAKNIVQKAVKKANGCGGKPNILARASRCDCREANGASSIMPETGSE